MAQTDDPTTWFPVGGANGKTAPPATNADDPVNWFPVGGAPVASAPPPATVSDIAAAGTRIGQAATQAYTAADPYGVLARPAQDWLAANVPWAGSNVINPLAQIVSRDIAAAGAGTGAALYEAGSAVGGPALGRDINFLAPAVAVAVGATPEAARAGYQLNQTQLPGGANYSRGPTGGGPVPIAPAGAAPAAPSFLSPEFRANPLSPELQRLTPRGTPPPAALPPGPTEAVPPSAVAPPVAAPSPSVMNVIPTTSEAAKGVASAYYDTFDKAAQDGGSLAPQATNKFIASVEAAAPPPGIGQAVAGKNAITDLVERLQPYKDQPMSLQDTQAVDKQLGNLITAEYGKTGVSDIGRQLQDIQQNFRDQMSNPAPGDVVAGQAGLDALAPARQAYAQAMKMDTIERIQQRADMTDNPTTSVRTQIRTLLNNPRASRGFTDQEKDALRDAANRGVASTALHILGSRLTPIIAGSVGSAGGPLGALASGVTAHVLGEGARRAENALAASRMQKAITVLGRGVPPAPNPLTPPNPP